MAMTTALYIALTLFLLGTALRAIRMFTMPMHVRWELYPVPEGLARQTGFMLSEIFLFKGLFDRNRQLWIWSWLFHIALYLLTATAAAAVAASFISPVRGILASAISVIAGAAFILGSAGACALIMMRLGSRKLRPFTTAADLINLLLLLAIFASGLVHAFLQPDAASIIIAQAGALLRMNAAPQLHPAAAIHLYCIAVFIAYFPFTQMAHSFMKYFTYHSVRWDDRPAGLVAGFPRRLQKYLAFPASWSAQHVRNGKSSVRWADVVQAKQTDGKKGAQG